MFVKQISTKLFAVLIILFLRNLLPR